MTCDAASDDLWIRRLEGSGRPEARLVCFPHAGGSASYYLPMAKSLTPSTEVVAIQYPGRQDRYREPCIDNIDQLADLIYAALDPWTNVPFAFFGHSMGAILGFEVALRFQRDARPGPSRLFASSRRAPSRPSAEKVHEQDDTRLLDTLRRVGGTDDRILADADVAAMILRPTRADYRAVETYSCRPGELLACPVSVLVGDHDTTTSVADGNAWRQHTTGDVELRVFPGGHFYLDSCVSEVGALILAALQEKSPVNSFEGSDLCGMRSWGHCA